MASNLTINLIFNPWVSCLMIICTHVQCLVVSEMSKWFTYACQSARLRKSFQGHLKKGMNHLKVAKVLEDLKLGYDVRESKHILFIGFQGNARWYVLIVIYHLIWSTNVTTEAQLELWISWLLIVVDFLEDLSEI